MQHPSVHGRLKYLHHTHILVRLCTDSTYSKRCKLSPSTIHQGQHSAIFLLQVLIEDAEFLMNRAAAGEVSWDDVRPQVAEKYEQADLKDVAEFVNAVQ